jgi:hypothetical protein
MKKNTISLAYVLILCFLQGYFSIAHAQGQSPVLQQRIEQKKQLETLREEYQIRKRTSAVKRISIYQAYAIYKSGKALLISVDYPGTYKHRRIIGSINIPIDTIKYGKRPLKLPTKISILLYCR